MDKDVKIKLIFAGSMTVIYSVLFLTQRIDIATAIALTTLFTNTITGVIVRNLSKGD